jgi:steroid 5-alpha reductase family enzyme
LVPVNIWQSLGSGWLIAAAAMALLWLAVGRRNGGVVDVAWSFATGLLGVWFAFNAAGWAPRQGLVAALAGIWGVRLGLYLLRRVASEAEDGRYQALKAEWGDRAATRLFYFFQAQAFWAVMFATPMLIAARAPHPAFTIGDLAGLLIWLLAIGGESLADRQLAAFRADPARRGQVCREGLWRYSRHPNYFFEWVHWWAYVAIGIAAPWGWLTLAGPVAMYYFITRVTGIPPTEARALVSRGDAYRDYQRTTSAFFPRQPRT